MRVGRTEVGELELVGALLVVQGVGSAIAAAAGGQWGLLAVAERWWPVPGWAGFAVATAGIVLAACSWGWRRASARRR